MTLTANSKSLSLRSFFDHFIIFVQSPAMRFERRDVSDEGRAESVEI